MTKSLKQYILASFALWCVKLPNYLNTQNSQLQENILINSLLSYITVIFWYASCIHNQYLPLDECEELYWQFEVPNISAKEGPIITSDTTTSVQLAFTWKS
jgi:hypothetical protein